jgi:periplasmic protein TonB
MRRGTGKGGLRDIGERLAERLETWCAACEHNQILMAYTRLRSRFSGPPLPGAPQTTHLDPFVILSIGLHLLAALLIYLLAARAFPLSERPPVSVRILETKAQAPAAAREQQPLRREQHRQAERKPLKRTEVEAVRPKAQARAAPPKPQPVTQPTLTPKSVPRVASITPPVPRPIPKSLPTETINPRTSTVPSAEVVHAEKGLTPMPVKPFEAAPLPASAPTETPRSLAAPPPAVSEAGPVEISPLPAPTATAAAISPAAVPTQMSTPALEGFQQPTGPVVLPDRFLKGGRPQTAPGAALELIDTSDPDFTEYFELIKRRVYAAWRYPKGVRGVQKVSVRFTLDRAGASHDVTVVRSTNSALDVSAAQAMSRASPFPPIPEKFRALVGQPLTLIFTVTVQ